MDFLIESVLIIGADEFYRTSRYKIPLFVILINTDDKNAFNILEKCTRRTDIIQQLNSDLLVVFLTHTNHDSALLFVDKIRDKFDFTYTGNEFTNSDSEFVKTLFVENSKKIQNDFNQY